MSRLSAWLILGATLAFLIGPFVIVVFAGMSAGEALAFPPQGLSLKWYAKIFAVESFRASFALSMFLAVFGTLAALLIGMPAAYALNRYDLPGSETIRTIVAAPIIVPGIIVGLALLRHFVVPLDVTITMALFVTHTALVLPYAVRVISSSLANLGADMEEAAVVLGCSRLQAVTKAVLPNVRGGILAAFILGFVTSFNEVPASLFLSGPGVRTLPIDMLSYMEITFDPSVAALSALLAFMSVAIVFLAERLLGLSRYV
ncbi:MAG: ABC transporter permease [Rhodobacter sp.]|nr:ABC transporter permease [Rhodobacter sp.]